MSLSAANQILAEKKSYTSALAGTIGPYPTVTAHPSAIGTPTFLYPARAVRQTAVIPRLYSDVATQTDASTDRPNDVSQKSRENIVLFFIKCISWTTKESLATVLLP